MRAVCSIVVTTALAAAIATTAPAHAQPGATPPSSAATAPEPVPAGLVPMRHPRTARNLSVCIPLATTLLGGVLVAAASGNGGNDEAAAASAMLILGGGILGPATGLWYAGKGGGLGILARTGAVAAFGYGVIYAISLMGNDCLTTDDCAALRREQDQREKIGLGLMAAGTIGFFWSWGHDVSVAGRTVERTNAARSLALTPAMLTGDRGRAPGAVLSLTF